MMKRRWSNYDAPSSRCNKCGWEGNDWAFEYQGLCSKCYKKWKKEEAAERKALKPSNDNIEMAEELIVTRNVKNRLRNKEESEIQHFKHYIMIPYKFNIIRFSNCFHP